MPEETPPSPPSEPTKSPEPAKTPEAAKPSKPVRPTGPTTWRDAQMRRATLPSSVQPRQRRALFLAGILLALVGAVVALLLFLNKPPVISYIALVVDQYTDPRIPPQAWADQDRKALTQFTWNNLNTFPNQQRSELLRGLRELGANLSKDDPLVIYLRAYACTDGEGVSLLPADAALDAPETWIPVVDLLAILKDCPVKNRLLLLDLTQPLSDARAGILGHDVAQRLQPLLEKAHDSDPTLQILCACSPGQVSLAPEEIGQSLFIYYLLQGLQGRADGAGDGGVRDGTVHVNELAAYVTKHVDRWAWINRGVRQTPKLLHAQKNFSLTVAKETQTAGGESTLSSVYPEKLKEAWAVRDGWWSDGGQRTPTEAYRRLDAALFRVDRRWRGGLALDAALEGYTVSAGDAVKVRDAKRPRRGVESLARAVARQGKEPDVNLKEVRQLLLDMARWSNAQPKTPDDEKNLKQARETLDKQFKDRLFDLAWTIWQVVKLEDKPSQSNLKYWYSLLKNDRSRLRYQEIDLLRDLVEWEYNPAKEKDWPGEVVALAVQLEDLLAEVPDPLDSDLEAWVRTPLEQAKDLHRQGLTTLLESRAPRNWAEPSKSLDRAKQEAQEVKERLQVLTMARARLDEALVLLPEYIACLDRGLHDREGVWREAADEATRVKRLLEQRPGDDAAARDGLENLRPRATALRDRLEKLRQALRPGDAKQLKEQSEQGSLDDSLKLRTLLDTPALSAGQRAEIWSAWLPLAERLHRHLVERERKPEAVIDPPPPLDLNRGLVEAADRGIRRVQLWLDLLRLNGAKKEDLDLIQAKLKDVIRDKERASPAAWQALREALRGGWKPLPEWAAP
jgi:hypothetical protein